MGQDPKEFQNLNSGLIKGEGLAQNSKTGDKWATDSIAIDRILGKSQKFVGYNTVTKTDD
jgi:hypothetical protein